MKLHIVINAGSGSHLDGDPRDLIANTLIGLAIDHLFFVAASGSDLPLKVRAASDAAQACGGALVAAGGDGTINQVASEALKQRLPLGVIPLGTFNYFGREHGISLNPAEAARALKDAQITREQVGFVNERLFLINASLGLYAAIQEEREQHKRRFGRKRLIAILSGLNALLETPRALTLEIERDGQREVLRTPSLFVANNRLQMGRIGLDPQDLDALDNGRLAAIVVKPTSVLKLLGLALFGALGRLRDDRETGSFNFSTLIVKPRRDRFVKVATDGEVQLMRTPLKFRAGPHALKLLKPAPADRVPVQ
jgi:diacylglycerol kinase family enzyme